MAFFQVLCWQDIPSQIKAWDDFDEVKVDLGLRFTERIDRAAQSQGLTSTDDYLAQWKWSEEQERAGTAQEVAEAVKKELESAGKP
jgi:Virulence factor